MVTLQYSRTPLYDYLLITDSCVCANANEKTVKTL